MAASALYRRFRETAATVPGQRVLTFVGPGSERQSSYTYQTLFERVEALGSQLRSRSIGRSAPVGILLSSQEAQTLHYLAALDSGLVPAILTPPNRKLNQAYYRETMEAVLRRSQFAAIITDIDSIELPTRGLAPDTFEEFVPEPRQTAADSAQEGRSLDASFMQFSSGTTGIKRGVLVTDEAVLAQLETYASAIGLRGDLDCIVSWLPLYHDMGFIACLNMPLACGVHAVMIDPIDWVSNPVLFLRAISEHRGTLAWNPNFAYAFMAQRVRAAQCEEVDLSSVRGLFNCAEPATLESEQAFGECFAPQGLARDVFKGCYAMAETTFALTHGEPDDPQRLDRHGPADGTKSASAAGHLSVGRPLEGVELAVIDPERATPLPDRQVGELWARSPFNFSGYYNDPDATQKAFVDGWYRTGDLGYRVEGAFYVVGRLKDVLIVGGVNVFPQDIEDLVSGVDGVQAGRVSAFSAFDDRAQTEHIVILAESPSHGSAEARQVSTTIRQRVLAAFQISNFEVRLLAPGWLVKSSSGKMARSANRDKWRTARGGQ